MSAIEITGGAGPRETAAILAVVAHVVDETRIATASPPPPPRQSAWVLAWRPREIPAAMPAHSYDLMPWGERDAGDEEPA